MATVLPANNTTPPSFSRSSSLSAARSPDMASPSYPERAIRPLPRSRLKSKLSPTQASTIIYPPDPAPVSPTLSFGGRDGGGIEYRDSFVNGDVAHGQYLHHRPHYHQHRDEVAVHHTHCTCGEELDSGEDEVEFDHPDYRYSTPSASGPGINGVAPPATAAGGNDAVLDTVQRRLQDAARLPPTKALPQPTSATSSADGYESFENTSNKKKRKIPLSATSSMHQSQLSAEMASMGLNGSVDGAMDDVHGGRDGVVTVKGEYLPTPPASAVSSAGTGISGAGRGRYGRQNGRVEQSLRRPLGSSSVNSVNGYQPRPAGKGVVDVRSASDADLENTGGIISQAIKTAAEQGPISPQRGQELASLLQNATPSHHGHVSANVNPNVNANAGSPYVTPATSKTQFTFSVESESANKMVDHQQALYGSPPTHNAATARGNMNGQPVGPSNGKGSNNIGPSQVPRNGQNNLPQTPNNARGPPPNTPLPPPLPPNQQPLPPQPKPLPPRPRPSKEYALAARQRRLQQEYTNYHHRPLPSAARGPDSLWICEFCEYEDIFGVPPVALIRQYEIKDRAERKRVAEKRRLLEKAKAKGRKGKKGSKNKGGAGALNNNLGPPAAPLGNSEGGLYDPALDPLNRGPGEGMEGEEFYDDEEDFDDEFEGEEGDEGLYEPLPLAHSGGGRAMPGSYVGDFEDVPRSLGVPGGGGGG